MVAAAAAAAATATKTPGEVIIISLLKMSFYLTFYF